MTRRPWRDKVRDLLSEVKVLQLAMRHPRTPWYAKALAGCVVGYALSPIDLIPDSIPVLGYLDDLILVPLGLAAVRRLIPTAVLVECRQKARSAELERSRGSRIMAAVIILVWLVTAGVVTWLLVWPLLLQVGRR